MSSLAFLAGAPSCIVSGNRYDAFKSVCAVSRTAPSRTALQSSVGTKRWFGSSSIRWQGRPILSSSLKEQGLSIRMAVTEVETLDEFDMVLQLAGDKLVVVDIGTSWCGPCKVIYPKFEAFSEKYTDAVYIKVQGDKNKDMADLCKRLKIRSVPTFQFYRNKEVVHQLTGAKEAELEQGILNNISVGAASS
mmetsp:Transcript_3711/g.5625  ORF Transcript_3711/g.5625 Transcript_3711/m.5625 type:complete len:191 (+) Transcript_3711:53-625(+)